MTTSELSDATLRHWEGFKVKRRCRRQQELVEEAWSSPCFRLTWARQGLAGAMPAARCSQGTRFCSAASPGSPSSRDEETATVCIYSTPRSPSS